MSLSERIQQINREISATVERALSEVRQEVSQRLRASQDEVLRRLDEITPSLPVSFLSDQDVSPLAEQMAAVAAAAAGAASRRGAFAELRDAMAAIDRSRSQAEILAALLRESSRFSSRAAMLLLRGGDLRGWGGQGFGEAETAIRELSLPAGDGTAFGRLAQSQAAVRLNGAECAELCSRIEASLPQEGLLVPLVLRDRVAAGLYADRLDGELAAEALQVLCYVAAQAIELLPFRERPSTPTLTLEGEGMPSPAAPAAPTAPEPAPVAAPSGATASAAAQEPQPTPGPAPEPAYVPYEPEAPEVEVEAEPEPAPWATSAEVEEEVATVADIEAEPEEVAAEPEPAWSAAPASDPVPVSPAATVYQPIPAEALRAAAQAPPEPAASPAASDITTDATVLMQRPSLREVGGAGLREAPPPAPTPLRPVPPPSPMAQTPPPSEAASTSSAGLAGSPEVKPPSDVEGPGWAFATGRVAVSPNEEAVHEEARRLARLLVSEIKLYNEEQVEEGRRRRDVYERLREDIDRSRQMYEERVEPRILKTTDYFYQELVRILAAGDAKALGI